MKNDKVHFSVFFHQQMIFSHKSKVDGLKKFWNESVVGFLIQYIVDNAQCPLVDFWGILSANLESIEIRQNSGNYRVLCQIVWSWSSIFKLYWVLVEGCYRYANLMYCTTFLVGICNQKFVAVYLVLCNEIFQKG